MPYTTLSITIDNLPTAAPSVRSTPFPAMD